MLIVPDGHNNQIVYKIHFKNICLEIKENSLIFKESSEKDNYELLGVDNEIQRSSSFYFVR